MESRSIVRALQCSSVGWCPESRHPGSSTKQPQSTIAAGSGDGEGGKSALDSGRNDVASKVLRSVGGIWRDWQLLVVQSGMVHPGSSTARGEMDPVQIGRLEQGIAGKLEDGSNMQ